jgi:hypothetical protein
VVEEKVSELEGALATLQEKQLQSPGPKVSEDSVQDRLEAVEIDTQQVKDLVEELSSNLPKSITSLFEKVDVVVQRVSAIEERSASTDDNAVKEKIYELTERLELVESSLAPMQTKMVAQQEALVKVMQQHASPSPDQGDVAEALQQLHEQISSLQNASDSCIELLNEHVARSDQRFAEIEQRPGAGTTLPMASAPSWLAEMEDVRRELEQLAEAQRLGSELMETLSSSLDGTQRTTEIMQSTLQGTSKQLQALQGSGSSVAAESIELLQQQLQGLDRKIENLEAAASTGVMDSKSIDALQARLSSEVESRLELSRTVERLQKELQQRQPESGEIGGHRLQNLTSQLQLVTARLEQHICETQGAGAGAGQNEIVRLQASLSKLQSEMASLKNKAMDMPLISAASDSSHSKENREMFRALEIKLQQLTYRVHLVEASHKAQEAVEDLRGKSAKGARVAVDAVEEDVRELHKEVRDLHSTVISSIRHVMSRLQALEIGPAAAPPPSSREDLRSSRTVEPTLGSVAHSIRALDRARWAYPADSQKSSLAASPQNNVQPDADAERLRSLLDYNARLVSTKPKTVCMICCYTHGLSALFMIYQSGKLDINASQLDGALCTHKQPCS